MIKHITLVLGDNDFGITFKNMLKTIHNLLEYKSDITEQQMTLVIMKGICFHYRAFQNLEAINKHALELKEIEETLNYLYQGLTIYYNEDACKMCEEDWDSGAWHLDVASGQISYL